MISPEHSEAPDLFAGNLTQEIASRLARAVEIDRLEVGKFLPHDMMLNRLRPTLQRVNGSERTPTPLRFFCMPFEDLLIDRLRTEKQRGCISRSSVALIWTWVGQTLLPLETKTYCRNFKTAIAAADHAAGKAHAEDFWAITAYAMREALAGEAGRSTARRVLKDDLVCADAEEVALLLGVAPAIIAIQETLVRPVHELTGDHLRALRAIHDGLIETAPEAAPYVALIATNRLARPVDALKLSFSFRAAGDLNCSVPLT